MRIDFYLSLYGFGEKWNKIQIFYYSAKIISGQNPVEIHILVAIKIHHVAVKLFIQYRTT